MNLLFNIRKITPICDHEDFNKDYPGDPEVKNPSTNSGDIHLIPDPGRSLMPRNK